MRYDFIEKIPRLLTSKKLDYGVYLRSGYFRIPYTAPEIPLSSLDVESLILTQYFPHMEQLYKFSSDPEFEIDDFRYVHTGEIVYDNHIQSHGKLSHSYLMQGEADFQKMSAGGSLGMEGQANIRLYQSVKSSLRTGLVLKGNATLTALQTTARLQRHWQGQAEIPRLQSLGQTGKSGKAEIERLKASALFSQYGHGKATLQSLGVRGSLGVSGQAEVQPLSAKGAYRREISFYGAAGLQPISIQGSLVYDRTFSGQAAFRSLRASGLGDFSFRLMTGAAALPHITADGQGFTGKNYHGLAELRQLLVEGKLTMIWQAESMQGEATLLPIQGQGMTDGSTGPLHGEAELPGLTVEWPRLTTKTDFHALQYKRFRQWQS